MRAQKFYSNVNIFFFSNFYRDWDINVFWLFYINIVDSYPQARIIT